MAKTSRPATSTSNEVMVYRVPCFFNYNIGILMAQTTRLLNRTVCCLCLEKRNFSWGQLGVVVLAIFWIYFPGTGKRKVTEK
jgi:hypothetical protein